MHPWAKTVMGSVVPLGCIHDAPHATFIKAMCVVYLAALAEECNIATQVMQARCSGLADAGYTTAQYAVAVRAIVESPYNAVPRPELERQLGGTEDQNTAVLLAMVRANLLGIRPSSTWAKDIAIEVFGSAEQVVTAPSPVHLHVMRTNDTLRSKLGMGEEVCRAQAVAHFVCGLAACAQQQRWTASAGCMASVPNGRCMFAQLPGMAICKPTCLRMLQLFPAAHHIVSLHCMHSTVDCGLHAYSA